MSKTSRLEQLQEFLLKEPNDPFLRYAIALEEEAAGKIKLAHDLLQKLSIDQPDYTATYYHLGRLKVALGNKDEALRVFETGILKAKSFKQQHVLAELQSAYNNLLFDDE